MRALRLLRPVGLVGPIAMRGLAVLLTLVLMLTVAGCGSTASGGPGTSSAPGGLMRVGRADDGITVSARVGDTIQIALGADLDWTVDPPAPAGILGPYTGPVTLVGGVQAHYTAAAPGTVTIVANGRPRCPPYAACTQVIVPFRTSVAVR